MCGGGRCCKAKGGSVERGEVEHEEHEASAPEHHEEEPKADVEGHEGEHDDLHEMIGHEMMGAIHRKDHKALMHTVEAAVLNCLSKRGEK